MNRRNTELIISEATHQRIDVSKDIYVYEQKNMSFGTVHMQNSRRVSYLGYSFVDQKRTSLSIPALRRPLHHQLHFRVQLLQTSTNLHNSRPQHPQKPAVCRIKTSNKPSILFLVQESGNRQILLHSDLKPRQHGRHTFAADISPQFPPPFH
jgi:hypothetical protein